MPDSPLLRFQQWRTTFARTRSGVTSAATSAATQSSGRSGSLIDTFQAGENARNNWKRN